METVNTTKAPRTTRKKAAVKGANKKPRSQRPKLVLNDTKELVIVKAKMEQAEAAAPVTKLRGRRKAQAAQVVVSALPTEKKPYTGKTRGRKSNAVLAAEAALAANTPTHSAPAPVKGAVSAAAPKATRKVATKAKGKVKTKAKAKAAVVPAPVVEAPAPVVAKRGRVATKVAAPAPVAVVAKRGPGRPKAVVAPVAAPVEAVVKRGPGRPKAVKTEVVAQAPAAKRGRKPKEPMLNNEPALTVKLDDYAVFYTQKGLDDYKALLSFMQEYSVPVKQAIGLLSGAVSVPTEDALTLFKLGRFRIKNLAHAEHAAKLRNSMRKSAPNVYYKATFTNALARVSAMKGFSDKQLQKNMDKFFMGVEKADTVEGFERQILEIYNTNLAKKDRLVLQSA